MHQPVSRAFRLRCIAARSHALLGDHGAVTEILDQVHRDQDDAGQHHDSLSEETGGEFAFSRARAEACLAAAWLDLRCGQEAFDAAQRAMGELLEIPVARRSSSQINGARIDAATASLLNGDRDSAAEALQPVLTLPAPVRNVSLTGRLARTRNILLSPAWAGDGCARQLADDIGEWLTQALNKP